MANRILIGDYSGGGDYRIRLSRQGYDVTAALDPERLAFDSTWKDGAKIYMKGTVAVPETTNNVPSWGVVNFPEVLPYVPFAYFWRVNGANQFRIGGQKVDQTQYRPYPAFVTTSYIKFGPHMYDSNGHASGYIVGYVIIVGPDYA